MWEDKSSQLCNAANNISLSILFLCSSPCRRLCVHPCVHRCTPTPIACLHSHPFQKSLQHPSNHSFALCHIRRNTKVYTQDMLRTCAWLHIDATPSLQHCVHVTVSLSLQYKAAGSLTEEIRMLLY